MPVFVKASSRAKAYTRSAGAVHRSGLKMRVKQARGSGLPHGAAISNRHLGMKNSIAWYLNYGKARSPRRRMQLRNTMDRLEQSLTRLKPYS